MSSLIELANARIEQLQAEIERLSIATNEPSGRGWRRRAEQADARLAAAEQMVEALVELHATDCYVENEYGHSCDGFHRIMDPYRATQNLNSTEHE